MTVKDALSARHATRTFLPTPVEKEKLDAIFAAAARTPSWANSQPWEVFVATGKTMDRIKAAYKENHDNKVPPNNDTPAQTTWTEEAVKRREQLQAARAAHCGVAGDEAKKLADSLNQSMYSAPTVIYIYMDRSLGNWSHYDIGAYAQSIMLLATGQGLDTMPATNFVLFPDVVRRELNVPDNLKLVFGIGIGYADKEKKINSFVSDRKSVSETVRYSD